MILLCNLRGSGGGFGIQAITDFGAGPEQVSEDNNLGEARGLLGELPSYLELKRTWITAACG